MRTAEDSPISTEMMEYENEEEYELPREAAWREEDRRTEAELWAEECAAARAADAATEAAWREEEMRRQSEEAEQATDDVVAAAEHAKIMADRQAREDRERIEDEDEMVSALVKEHDRLRAAEMRRAQRGDRIASTRRRVL